MAIKISGILRDGMGRPIPKCTIELKSRKTSATVIVETEAQLGLEITGAYNLQVEPGKYAVSLYVVGFPPKRVGDIIVCADSIPGTLNDFLTMPGESDLTPELVAIFEQLRNEAQHAATEAKANNVSASSHADRAELAANSAISTFGYIPIDSFQLGATITLANQVLRDETTGKYYRWDGLFPKVVSAGSTPESTGGVGDGAWMSVGDASLRSDLASPEGAGLVGSKGGSVQEMIGIEVDSLDALASIPVANITAGDLIRTRKEGLTLSVLENSDSNAVYDFSDVGGGKFTYLNGITRTFSNGTKSVAYSRAQADIMSVDLSTMVGYAASAGVTGGTSGVVYWVTNTADDIFTRGCLRWAIDQVRLAGGGRVLFHPRGMFDVYIGSQIIIPSNITIDAPGRNARIWAPTDITRFKITSCSNVIIRRLHLSSTPGVTETMRDSIWITPDSADNIWIDQCSFRYAGDGCIDMTTLPEILSVCRVTVSRCLIRMHDKGMLLGSLACYNPEPPSWCPIAAPDAVKLFVTMYQNYFDSVGQRQPKVVSQAFVDSVNNVRRISQQARDDGSIGAAYGILTATGGAAISRGDYFMSAAGTGWSGVDAVRTVQNPISGGSGASDGPGAVDFTNETYATDGITLASFSPELIPNISYELNPTSIPSTSYGRRKFADAISASAGAEIDSAPAGVFVWVADSMAAPNAFDVISETSGVGRWHRVDKDNEVPLYASLIPLPQTLSTPRIRTQVIAGGAITVPATGTYFAVDTENAESAGVLSTINGASDGRWIVLRSASASRQVTVNSTGNIAVASDYALARNTTAITLYYDATVAKWILINKQPVHTSTWNGTEPLRLGNYYLWVDSGGRLRMKNTAPTLDIDGVIVGSQS